jgi:hypothetical protein
MWAGEVKGEGRGGGGRGGGGLVVTPLQKRQLHMPSHKQAPEVEENAPLHQP